MLDQRTEREWHAPHSKAELAKVGLSRMPDLALLGLIRSQIGGESDPVGELVRRDAFQRACVALARESTETIAGRVGDHGVVFLTCSSENRSRARTRLERLAEKAARIARERFALSLHFGASALQGMAALGVRYEEALGAAEQALSLDRALVHATTGGPRVAPSTRRLRRELGVLAEQNPRVVRAIFERYMQAVLADSGYRLDLVRVQLESGLDEISRPLLKSGVLDDKSYQDMCETLERATRDVATVAELAVVYRSSVADLIELVEHPARGARTRGLRRGIAYIHRHFGEELKSESVAKIAGFAPAHFCRLFKQREGVTFEAYLRNLRLERARQLLSSTDLSIERVGQLSGFALRPYFHRVFKSVGGLTPREYRRRVSGVLES
jgi:AraC-like DNA-binding protein